VGDGIPDPGILHHFDAGDDESDLSGSQFRHLHRMGGKDTDLDHLVGFAAGHEANFLALFQHPVKNPHQDHHALVRIIPGVENQCFQGCGGIPPGSGDLFDHRFEDVVNADSLLGAGQHCIRGIQADDFLDLFADALRFGAGQIDLVENRKNLQVVVDGQVDVGQGLSFHPLGGIDH